MADSLANDLLEGAREIASFMYGKGDDKTCKRVYYLAEIGAIPAFRHGAMLCARKSKILASIEQKEKLARGRASPLTLEDA